MNVKIMKIKENAVIPKKGSPGAAGADLYACLDDPIVIMPNTTVGVPLGIKTEFDEGYVALIYARSGLAIKRGLAPANKVGVIDSDYRGEWIVALHNQSGDAQVVDPGERIAQVVFQKIENVSFVETDNLEDSVRGEGGFGSTGR